MEGQSTQWAVVSTEEEEIVTPTRYASKLWKSQKLFVAFIVIAVTNE